MIFHKRLKTDSFISLVALIKRIGLSQTKYDNILAWGEVYGRLLYTNHAGIYRDDEFEKLLVETYVRQLGTPTPTEIGVGELHVITDPFSTGGHTRLMERIIASRSDGDVLITRPVATLEERLWVNSKVQVWHNADQFNMCELIRIISKYKIVYLHITPNDLLASVAVAVAKKVSRARVIFVNHADHVFSFGFYAADIVAEVSTYGLLVSEYKRNVSSSFLGIPVDMGLLAEITPVRKFLPGKRFEIMSVGSRLKYRPSQNHSFPKVAMLTLKNVPTARIVVIGPSVLLDWWWWSTLLRYPQRLKVLPPMPYQLYLERIAEAQLYIDSTPMTGGTTVPEIRSRGVPVTGLTSASSGYSPLDATRFADITDLVLGIREYVWTGAGSILDKNNNKDTLDKTISVHGKASFEQRLNNIVIGLSNTPPTVVLSPKSVHYYRDQWRQRGVINFDHKSVFFLLKYRQTKRAPSIPFCFRLLLVSALPRLIVGYLSRLLKRLPKVT
jgi:hypothetical protein